MSPAPRGRRLSAHIGGRALLCHGVLAITWMAVLSMPASAGGQTVQTEDQQILAGDDDAGDRFGAALAVAGDLAVIGAPRDDQAGADAGAVYVWRRNAGSWAQEAKLMASDAGPSDEFGVAVAVGPDLVVVGAKRDDDGGLDSGAAYVFRRAGGNWIEEQKLLASDPAALDFFGSSVALASERILVGAPSDDDAGNISGAVYAYELVGPVWTQVQKLMAGNTAAGDSFGNALSMSHKAAVIGARAANSPGLVDLGAAYVFRHDGASWIEEQQLAPGDPQEQDLFGGDVAISNDVIVVGSDHDDDIGTESGAAYVFRKSAGTWAQEAKLIPADSKFGDNFGFTTAVCGDVIIVGSIGHDDAGNGSGSAYAFRRESGTWEEFAKLATTGAAAGDELGSDVGISGDSVVVGARLDDDGGAEAGSAYAFSGVAETGWRDLGFALAGAHGDPDLLGTGSLCGGDVIEITLSNALENSTAALVLGLTELTTPFKQGVLVPSPDLVVTGLPTGPFGSIPIITTLPAGLPANFSFTIQYWITDAAAPKNLSASNAIRGTTP